MKLLLRLCFSIGVMTIVVFIALILRSGLSRFVEADFESSLGGNLVLSFVSLIAAFQIALFALPHLTKLELLAPYFGWRSKDDEVESEEQTSTVDDQHEPEVRRKYQPPVGVAASGELTISRLSMDPGALENIRILREKERRRNSLAGSNQKTSR